MKISEYRAWSSVLYVFTGSLKNKNLKTSLTINHIKCTKRHIGSFWYLDIWLKVQLDFWSVLSICTLLKKLDKKRIFIRSQNDIFSQIKFRKFFGVLLGTMKRKGQGSEDTVHGLVAKRDFGSFVLLQNLELRNSSCKGNIFCK